MESMPQAADLLEECNTLYGALQAVPDERWLQPTQFKGWTFDDVIGHLHMFDHAAALTLQGREVVQAFFAAIAAARANGLTLTAYTRQWLGGLRGQALLRRWHNFYHELAAEYARQDPKRRVAWGGPDMSVRSAISARQMETWSHGQAIFDSLGLERSESDRVRNIVMIGVNTFGWTFANRNLPVPQTLPHLRLVSPSGAVWEWGSPEQTDRVEGSAVEFCQVVAQTRNVADTGLRVVGDVAHRWMSIAQCFAGPPEEPPAPHTRRIAA